MRVAAVFTAALALQPAALAVDQSKSAIVWFEDDSTPDWVINEAKDNIRKAGGKVTHEYTIIKGFAVVAPGQALETMSAWGAEHAMKIEEDDMVSIDTNSF